MNTDCIVEAGENPELSGRVRFLQIQRRIVEVAQATEPERFRAVDSIELDGRLLTSWEEGIEREVAFEIALKETVAEERTVEFVFQPTSARNPSRTAAQRWRRESCATTNGIAGVLRIRAQRIEGR